MPDAAAPPVIRLPPLYSRMEPLNPAAHGKLRLRDAGHHFASELAAVPVALEEFAHAARHMAIVFASDVPHMPVAVTGLRANSNHFVQDGKWREGGYVPSYLRRFPFFLVRMNEQGGDLALCLDPSAPQISETEGEPLFDAKGEATETARRAFEFSRAVENAFVRTREMAEGLAKMGLLGPSSIEFIVNGQQRRMDGFHAVQRDAMAKLSAKDLATLRDRGWLEAIYAHIVSMGGIPELASKVT
ncbi:SapC family protein [Sabulicella glaciei]|uniref:SapC family protein n=1 Tax=Sabulicella glaciei TaxID=2984948 RepID=A0ABT3P030_9PROT|nr:SapC family protein [Roseococcus sp. MDT2-1-1]MCW8087764.1 SapC family protein [Roseococcus sp. MDT2-1-1]